jgi:divalent metal cation (Fe/Co/Zn/Cd) transporter
MKVQSIIVGVFLVAAAVFVLLNATATFEARDVRLPWGIYAAPLAWSILVATTVTLGFVLLAGAISASAWTSAQRRLEDRLAQREREIADMKSRAYDAVSERLELLRRDLSGRIVALERAVNDRLPAPAAPGPPQDAGPDERDAA